MRDMHTAAPQPPVPTRSALPGWARDLIAAVLVLATTLGPLHRFTLALPPLAFVIAAVSAAAMFARRRYPWAVLVVCVVCFVVASFTLTPTPFSALATGIAVLTIATRHRRRTTLLTVLAVLAVLVPVSALHEHESSRPLTILVVAIVGLFAAVGDAIRSRRAYIDQITQRALDAEQTREVVASRRVAEDRLRIARDLHDAVAHQMSVINLHAGVATRTIDNDPEAAKAAASAGRSRSTARRGGSDSKPCCQPVRPRRREPIRRDRHDPPRGGRRPGPHPHRDHPAARRRA